MSSAKEKLKLYFQFYLYINKIKNATNNLNIGVFSNPRGGSTWLANSLNVSENSAIVWEPLFKYRKFHINALNPFSYPEIHEIGFGWNQHIPENANWQEAFEFFDALFAKEIKNIKLYRFNDLSKIKQANTFIYKFCFGNLVLPYLVNHFNLKSVFMLRHPCSVVSSQLNHSWKYLQKDATFNVPDMRFNDIYQKHEHLLKNIKYPEENLVALWAITNNYIIRHPDNNKKWITIAYEDLYLRKEEVLKKIYEKLNLKWTDKITIELNKKSFTSNLNTKSYIGKKEQLDVWKKRLTSDQIKRIFNLLDKFEIDYYSDLAEPDYSIIYNQK